MATTDYVDLVEAFGEALVSVGAIEADGSAHFIGNAFIVGLRGKTAMALTALHVADEIGRRAVSRSAIRGDYRDVLQHPHVTSNLRDLIGVRASDAAVFRVGPLTLPAPGIVDVAVCLMSESGPMKPSSRFGVQFYPPKVGDQVYASGHSSFRMLQDAGESGADWRFEAARTTVAGVVSGVYGKRAGVTPGPCFTIQGHFPSGLSGSPVVCDVAGRPYACGLVSDSDGTTAVASMLFPLLALKVATDSPEGEASVYERAKRGFLDVAPGDLDRFSVDGETVTADTSGHRR